MKISAEKIEGGMLFIVDDAVVDAVARTVATGVQALARVASMPIVGVKFTPRKGKGGRRAKGAKAARA